MFGALKRSFRSMAGLILVRNVVSELRPKRTLAASRGFLAAARLSCKDILHMPRAKLFSNDQKLHVPVSNIVQGHLRLRSPKITNKCSQLGNGKRRRYNDGQ